MIKSQLTTQLLFDYRVGFGRFLPLATFMLPLTKFFSIGRRHFHQTTLVFISSISDHPRGGLALHAGFPRPPRKVVLAILMRVRALHGTDPLSSHYPRSLLLLSSNCRSISEKCTSLPFHLRYCKFTWVSPKLLTVARLSFIFSLFSTFFLFCAALCEYQCCLTFFSWLTPKPWQLTSHVIYICLTFLEHIPRNLLAANLAVINLYHKYWYHLFRIEKMSIMSTNWNRFWIIAENAFTNYHKQSFT